MSGWDQSHTLILFFHELRHGLKDCEKQNFKTIRKTCKSFVIILGKDRVPKNSKQTIKVKISQFYWSQELCYSIFKNVNVQLRCIKRPRITVQSSKIIDKRFQADVPMKRQHLKTFLTKWGLTECSGGKAIEIPDNMPISKLTGAFFLVLHFCLIWQ